MSYDLHVYGRSELSPAELSQLVSRQGRLTAKAGSHNTTISTRRTLTHPVASYRFTVEGPLTVEREDVPGQRRGTVADRAVLYSVLVEGGQAEGIAAACSFANALAELIDGVVFDAQQEASPEPEPDVRSDVAAQTWMHFRWFRLRDDTHDLARVLLQSAREYFDLAVPTRFGSYEPMQGRLPRDTDRAFGDVYANECGVARLMFVNGRKSEGSLSGWSRDVKMRYHSAHVAVRLDAVEKADLVASAEDFFVDVAQRSQSFFAFIELNHSDFVTSEFGHFEGGWSGLPARPQWLTWFGEEYSPIVLPSLTDGVIRRHENAVTHRWTDYPILSSEIELSAKSGYWLDRRLVPTAVGHRVREPAAIVPSSLRSPEPGSPEALRLEALFAEMHSRSKPV